MEIGKDGGDFPTGNIDDLLKGRMEEGGFVLASKIIHASSPLLFKQQGRGREGI